MTLVDVQNHVAGRQFDEGPQPGKIRTVRMMHILTIGKPLPVRSGSFYAFAANMRVAQYFTELLPAHKTGAMIFAIIYVML